MNEDDFLKEWTAHWEDSEESHYSKGEKRVKMYNRLCKRCELLPMARGMKTIKCSKCGKHAMTNAMWRDICYECYTLRDICPQCGGSAHSFDIGESDNSFIKYIDCRFTIRPIKECDEEIAEFGKLIEEYVLETTIAKERRRNE